MTVRVHSARVSYNGADRLDITRASATGHGLAFAPSWRILRPAIDARRSADELRKIGAAAEAESDPAAGWAYDEAARTELDAWEAYVPAFIAEMRESYRTQRAAWEWL